MSFASSARRVLGGMVACAAAGTMGFAAPAMAEPQQSEPRNIIVMIGDGMGFNHVDASSLYEHGKTNWQVEGKPGEEIKKQDGYGETPSQVYENFDVQMSMKHPSLDSPEYKSEDAWGKFDWAKNNPTDSAASGTALATGTKTHNGTLGLDGDKKRVQNAAEYAHDTGRATGVVSSVPFGHATPAAWGAHVESRKENHKIAQQMIDGPLDVIMGGGHPKFDDDAQPRKAQWDWLSEEQYAGLEKDGSGRTFVEDSEGIEAIARGENVPERLFGLAPVAETLQFNRSSLVDAEPRNTNAGRVDGQPIKGEAPLPGEAEKNDVVSLPDMSTAALNVLSQDDDGFFTMIEGGAIDWAGHANATVGNLEEMDDFNKSVEAVTNWVEENSSWDETLLIVTADHETGYLNGAEDSTLRKSIEGEDEPTEEPSEDAADEATEETPEEPAEGAREEETADGAGEEGAAEEEDAEEAAIAGGALAAPAAEAPEEDGEGSGITGIKQWKPLAGEQGALPTDSWNSPQHTNHLVPLFARGAGSETISDYVKGTDPVRGDYIDNTDIAKLSFALMEDNGEEKPEEPSETPTEQPSEKPTDDASEEAGTTEEPKDDSDKASDDDKAEQPVAGGSGSNGGSAGSNGSGSNSMNSGSLPRTGTEIGVAAAIAAGLLATGTAAVVVGRRKSEGADA